MGAMAIGRSIAGGLALLGAAALALGSLHGASAIGPPGGGEAQPAASDTRQTGGLLGVVGDTIGAATATIDGSVSAAFETQQGAALGEVLPRVLETVGSGTAEAPAESAGAVSDLVTGQFGDAATQVAGPVLAPIVDVSEPVVAPAVETLERVAGPAVEVVEPVLEPVLARVEPVIEPIAEAAQPLVGPLVRVAEPVLRPVLDILEPAIEPVIEVIEPLLEPVVEVAEPIVEPIIEIVEPALPPVHGVVRPVPGPFSGPVDPGVGPVAGVVGPAPAPFIDVRRPEPEAVRVAPPAVPPSSVPETAADHAFAPVRTGAHGPTVSEAPLSSTDIATERADGSVTRTGRQHRVPLSAPLTGASAGTVASLSFGGGFPAALAAAPLLAAALLYIVGARERVRRPATLAYAPIVPPA
jgi:hypothetical protein